MTSAASKTTHAKRVTVKQRFLFDGKVPNAATHRAIKQLENGKGKRSGSARALFKGLKIL